MLLSLLEFCQSLKTYELAAYLLIETLQKFTLTPDLMETLVSFHHLNYLVLAAMQDLPTYASSLFVALQNLDTDKDPGPFVLSEMVSLGRHLSTSQLRMLRRKIHHWRSQSSMPASVPYMLSPPEDHDLTHHSPADLVARIQAFCLAYNKNPNDINNMLAGLLSTGPPLDLTGAIIPAVMQALLDLPQGRATFEPLLLLCSAAAQMPSSSSLKVHRNTAEEAWRALPSFSSAHGVFVQDLIVKNILSIGLVLDNICYPLLLQYSIHSPSESSISNLLDIITDLLLDHARNSPRVWRVRAAKSALYGHKSFLSAYHLAIQLSYIVYNQQNEAWWSQSRRIYERILGQPMFQTAFLRHLEEKNVTGKFPQGLSHGELTLLWDALVALVRSYCKGGLQTTSASEDTRFLAISAALLKHGAIYAPFVTSLGRCFFKTLVLRISQSASSTSAGLPPRALPRSVVEQYLQHLLEAPESSRQAQLTMFREYIGDDVCSSFFSLLQLAEICPCLTFKLLVSMFEMLSKKLELYRGDLQALVGLEEWESGLDKLRQIAQVTSLIASSRGTKETCSANLVDEDILRAVMQSAAGILSIVTPSLPTTLARSPLGHFLVIVTSDIVGLVRKWGGTALDATDMMRDFTTSLCFWCQDMPARQDFAQHIQDVLGWLLQCGFTARMVYYGPHHHNTDRCLSIDAAMPAASRNVVLNRFQISTASNDSARPQAISKQLSLGPSPLLNSVREGEERYITLQNSWRGISVKGNAPALDMKSNNEPIDFHKYQCRTGDIARHLQPKYRAKDRGSWSSFDSEIPWNNGTTPQRDFRRSTTTQLDFAPATQAQILRTRGSTQPDIGVHHLKGTSTHHSHNAKQSDKEKIGEGHSRDAATKKRKTVPDVVLIEESSPKKKVKTASNTTLPSGTKQVKNKS